jgi:transcriptional regulator with XRE-family HTH domain
MTDDAISRLWDAADIAVALRVRAVRAATGLSQTDFAATLSGHGVTILKPTVQAWENGRAAPTYAQMREMRRALGVTSDFIIYGSWRELSAGYWQELRLALIRLEEQGALRKEESPTEDHSAQ